jgi:hypothetical protein
MCLEHLHCIFLILRYTLSVLSIILCKILSLRNKCCVFHNINSLTGAVCSVMFLFGIYESVVSINKSLVFFSTF